MHIFIGPKGEVSETTRVIQEVTRGTFFEKWNGRDELTNEITKCGIIWNNLNLTNVIAALWTILGQGGN